MNKFEKATMDRLTLDSMKFKIVRYCDSNSKCEDRCFIKDVCKKNIAPNFYYLDDWSKEHIKEAYEILKVAEQEEW